jgi:mRNA-degrading endonuclease RelE of RelBE toxin-antitoxin system
MTFYEHIISLRKERRIPTIWRSEDIRPFLKNYFRSNTINVYPANCSITPDGKEAGDYVKKGQAPKFYRMGKGLYVVIEEYDQNENKACLVKENKRNNQHGQNNLDDLINIFNQYVTYFTENIKFSGPSTYFHNKTIDKIRNSRDYEALLDDSYFLELVYATLVSWGMHTMGKKGPKMVEFEDFKSSIIKARDQLTELNEFKLHTLTDDDFSRANPLLRSIFTTLKTMKSGSNLVGNSKVMHHLLPDLIPPIDRSHTLKFFYGNMNIAKDETELFIECVENFLKIARSVNDLATFPLTGFNTSIPKIIDNAIMGFIMKEAQGG